jgi:hypothetical protein
MLVDKLSERGISSANASRAVLHTSTNLQAFTTAAGTR